MRILFFTENFPPESNAAATRVFERAVHWVKAGHEVTVITCAPNFPEGRVFDGYRNAWKTAEMMDGIRVVRVKTYIAANKGVIARTLDFLSFMVTGFLAGLGEARPDVVVSTSPQFFCAVGAWATAACRRLPYVFELGDLWPASITAVGAMKPSLALRMVEKLELFLYRRADCVVALTHSFKRNLVSRGIEAGKIAVVINGVDLWRYGPTPKDEDLAKRFGVEGRFTVLYAGTLGMAHGLMNVLDAAEKLRDLDGLRFLLVGPGAEREQLMAEAEKRGLTNVIFQPRQPKETMPKIWSLADVALVHLKNSPAFAEVIPSKIFEAMGSKLAILLAAPKGEATDIIDATGAGVWVPAEDPAALADACRALSADPARVTRLAETSHAAAPDYAREVQASHMERVLLAVLDGCGGTVGDIPRIIEGDSP